MSNETLNPDLQKDTLYTYLKVRPQITFKHWLEGRKSEGFSPHSARYYTTIYELDSLKKCMKSGYKEEILLVYFEEILLIANSWLNDEIKMERLHDILSCICNLHPVKNGGFPLRRYPELLHEIRNFKKSITKKMDELAIPQMDLDNSTLQD